MDSLLPHNPAITKPLPFNSHFTALLSPFSRHSSIINPSCKSPSTLSSSSQFHRSFLGFQSKKPIIHSSRCQATDPGSPSPQKPDSSLGEGDTFPILGLEETFSKFQDRAQIFVAVLFWMSLFFWACATDGSNDGRPSKGSRFKR